MSTYVLQNKGTKEDARDLMQEALYQLYRLSLNPKRKRIENISGYFRSMYVNLWLKILKTKERQKHIKQLEEEDNLDIQEERYRQYRLAFTKLGKDCQQVIDLFLSGYTMEQIAQLLDTTVTYAKRKKYLCKEKLKKMVNP